MENLKISVVIPTFNREVLLEKTLISLYQQTMDKALFEVIIIDDGSTDNTDIMVKKYENNMNIKYLFQENKGYGAASARNKGIINSKGEVICFIDSGILLSTNSLEIVYNRVYGRKKAIIGYLYGFDEFNENKEYIEKLNIDPQHTDVYIKQMEDDGIGDLRENMYSMSGYDLKKWAAPWVIFWVGFSAVEKKELLEVGMFDESFNTWGCEDIDLGLSLYKNNISIELEKDFKGIHLPHEKFKSQLSKEELKKYVMKKRMKIHMKHQLPETLLWITMETKELNPFLLSLGNDYAKLNNMCNNNNLPSFYDTNSPNVIHLDKQNGTDVTYYLFNDFEIHYNEIAPKSIQDWHFHNEVDEIIYIINGELELQWIQGTTIKQINLCPKDLVKINKSKHRIINNSNKISKFIVFRKMVDLNDYREIFKTDKKTIKDKL